jgi:uncharacterized membrane protein
MIGARLSCGTMGDYLLSRPRDKYSLGEVESFMDKIPLSSRALFASGMIGIAIVGFCYGDFSSVWQGTPGWIPKSTHTPLAYAFAAIMLLGGLGLLVERTAAISARVLFYYLAVWVVVLRIPAILTSPQIEVNWQGLSEILVMLAGGWVLFAALTSVPDGSPLSFAAGKRGTRLAQLLFGFALLPLGIAHFAYLQNTAPLVPSWLPNHDAWAYLTGAAQVAAGVGVLISVLPRLAAILDAVLLSLFTFLVWVPLLADKPTAYALWSEFTTSWAITAGAWVVAASFSKTASEKD